MRLTIGHQDALSSNCNIDTYFGLNKTLPASIQLKSSSVGTICPNFFQLSRMEYMLNLLGLKEVELIVHNNIDESSIALSKGEADVSIFATYVHLKSFPNADVKHNLSFVAPFTQNHACMFQANHFTNDQQINDQFWITPYNVLCWIIFCSLLGFQRFVWPKLIRKYSDCTASKKMPLINFYIDIALISMATFIYIR